MPRLFLVESEYHLALRRAEAEWVRGLLKEFTDGTFPGIKAWQHFHDTGELPDEVQALAETQEGGGRRQLSERPRPGAVTPAAGAVNLNRSREHAKPEVPPTTVAGFLLAGQDRKETPVSTTDCAIEARQLVKTYAVRGKKHGIRALDGLDISVPRGMIHGLLGPNGAGKSTTVKILTSLARPDSGEARVEGVDVLARPGQVRHMIGVVAQRSGADPTATGRENLILQGRLYGLRGAAVRARADELLAHFGLTEAAGRLVKTYSGGMQRRLDVALGLMHRPAVLFLDEPTTGLDPESRAAMWQEIARLAGGEGMTVLLTTHYLEEADRLASRLAIVDRGRVVATGTPDELKGELRGDAVHVELPATWDDADANLVRSVLAGLPAVRDVVIAGRGVSARSDDGAAAVPVVLAGLQRAGVNAASVAVARPSLDDVYLRHTGRRYSESESPDRPGQANELETVGVST